MVIGEGGRRWNLREIRDGEGGRRERELERDVEMVR